MSTSGETPAHVPVDRADDLRADIINTRAELASTIDHLMAKADVKTRARHQMIEVKSTVREGVSRLPGPARQAVDRAAEVLTPLAKRARPYGKQITVAVVAVVFATVVLRRHSG
jgi:hypothetical protein